MSTATYLIASKSFTQKNDKACFYIHASGYPTSAAERFIAMYCSRHKRGGYAEQFFSGNDFVEFTDSHEVCPNTAYRYTLEKDGTLTAYQAMYHKKKSWQVIYQGAWHDFVNLFLQLQGTERFAKFTVDVFYQISSIMTVAEAMEYLEKITARLIAERAKPAGQESDPVFLTSLEKSAAVLSDEINQALHSSK